MEATGAGAPEPALPAGFLWGAATSAHQVEGDNIHADWWEAELAEQVPYRSGEACRHLERYPQDIRLLASVGLNAYRFSVEWARLQPHPDSWDHGHLRRYVHMAHLCRENGVTPLVTLNHFTLPAWLARRGGWLSREAPAAFAAYAARVVAAMGDAVGLYATVNEPIILALQAYLEGLWPPGQRRLATAVAVARQLARAHRVAYSAVRTVRPQAAVGAVKQMVHFRPLRPHALGDSLLTQAVRRSFNEAWLDSVADVLDWIGVNYYTVMHCGWQQGRPVRSESRQALRARTDMGWEVHPAGLHRVLHSLARFGRPIYITENGIATADDEWRCRFLRAHLRQAARAIADGLDLRGYFHWSLLDNFEWAQGYRMRFGLVEVDRATQERRPRPSLHYLGAMARANAVLRRCLPGVALADRA